MNTAAAESPTSDVSNPADVIEAWHALQSQLAWERGRLIAEFCQTELEDFASESDFVQNVGGVSIDEAKRLRRVWETFAEVKDDYPALDWLHFSTAIDWEDRSRWLKLANRRRLTVKQMRSRRWNAQQR